jgi:predicted DNA-binding ribbon-helix-helix protein
MVNSSIHKRSVTLDRHRTSVSLESPFWDALKKIADERRISLNTLIEDIDHERMDITMNLSAALRVYVLQYYQRKVGENISYE